MEQDQKYNSIGILKNMYCTEVKTHYFIPCGGVVAALILGSLNVHIQHGDYVLYVQAWIPISSNIKETDRDTHPCIHNWLRSPAVTFDLSISYRKVSR